MMGLSGLLNAHIVRMCLFGLLAYHSPSLYHPTSFHPPYYVYMTLIILQEVSQTQQIQLTNSHLCQFGVHY